MKSYLKKDNTYYKNLDEWRNDYEPFLEQLFINKMGNQCKDPYQDPDSYYTNTKEIYIDMAKYLNIQEKKLKDRLNGDYEYSYDEDKKFIKVINKEDNGFFYLKSDQFGFSAPSKKKDHPYDTYILSSKDKKKAIKNVAKWVYESRTIGGAFLWALENNASGKLRHDFNYNTIRGGSISVRGGSYIQDRVDLTLLEIQTVLERQGDCLLARQNNGNMQKWLDHFIVEEPSISPFVTYIDFFGFNNFVKGRKEYKIINTINSDLEDENNKDSNEKTSSKRDLIKTYESIDEVYGKKIIYSKGEVQLRIDELEKMLNNVNCLIKKRTDTIEKTINK